MGSVLHQANYAIAGAVSFLIFAAATVAQLSLARLDSRPVTLAGLGLFLAGLSLIVAGLSAASLALFLAGTVTGGVAVGALFIGSLSTANRLAPADSRAQILSTYFVFAYSGLIIPVVGVGTAATDYVGDFRAVARLFRRPGRPVRLVGHRHLRPSPCRPGPQPRSSPQRRPALTRAAATAAFAAAILPPAR